VIKLTELQNKYMEFVNHFIAQNDNFPTIQDFMEQFGVSHNGAYENIKRLKKKGVIEHIPRRFQYRRSQAYLDSL